MSATVPFAAEAASKHRPEIQGLRAIAVLVVLFFHVWPSLLPGGYVGVDVFFVISGYLITGLLLREQDRTGTIDLVRFYGRRVKRLLPAASVVMLAVALGASLFPRMRWGAIAEDIMGSALYVENWLLASRAVDYLAAEEAASPLQHFWSLSLEEQYYVFWPMLLLCVGWFVRKSNRALVPVVTATLLAVFGVSLAYSMWITKLEPGFAYFATTTRAWELALGGLLAAWSGWRTWPALVRAIAAWAGVAMIAAAALRFGTDTAFPGYAALLPTVGSALVLVSGSTDQRWSAYRVLRTPPMQVVGDLSYSLYLWHWPLIVAYRAMYGEGEIGLAPGVALLAASLLLAWASKRWVEDYFRAPAFASQTRWRPVALGATSMLALVCAGGVLAGLAASGNRTEAPTTAARDLHPGALALEGARVPANVAYVPTTEQARNDLADAYAANCISPSIGRDVRECRYGDARAKFRVVAVGDSHMVQWLPALQRIATRNGWNLLALTKTGCAFAVLDEAAMTSEGMKSCAEWNRKAASKIVAEHPDLVLVAQSSGALGEIAKDPARGPAEVERRMALAWRTVAVDGTRLAVIRETPRLGWDAAECLSRPGADIAACTQQRAKAVPPHSAIEAAAATFADARLIDLTDTVCTADACAPVIGNVLVWRDKHHLTATYARSLAPLFADQLRARVPGLPMTATAADMREDAKVAAGANAATPARTKREEFSPTLVGGLKTLPFDYEVRVNNVVTTRDGRAVREFGLEFLDGDVATVDGRVADAFRGVGYLRESPTLSGSARRSVFRKAGNPDVLVWVRRGAPRGERFRIQSPDAKGTVYMAWDQAVPAAQ
jgi:peptidoglycan/LPS O-acetylase OafA/YrhL